MWSLTHHEYRSFSEPKPWVFHHFPRKNIVFFHHFPRKNIVFPPFSQKKTSLFHHFPRNNHGFSIIFLEKPRFSTFSTGKFPPFLSAKTTKARGHVPPRSEWPRNSTANGCSAPDVTWHMGGSQETSIYVLYYIMCILCYVMLYIYIYHVILYYMILYCIILH